MRAFATLPRRAWASLRADVLVLPSRIFVFVGVVALVALPLIVDDRYVLRIVTMAAIFAVFAASWDLLAGYAGQVNFGHALFFGIGAYSSALLSQRLGLPVWLTMPLGALAAMLAGFLVGIPCLRLRGAYLSLATLALPIIAISLLFAFPGFSGGELGISGLRRAVTSPVGNYYLAVLTMLASVFVMWKIGDSKIGLVLHAIREDEVACRASGINTVRYKLAAFAISAFFAGAAGAMLAHFLRVAGPSSFEVALSFQVVIWGVFGGVATIYGPVVAVFVLYPLTEMLAAFELFRSVRLLGFAVIVLAILLLMPRGLAPWLRDKIEAVCPRCKNRNAVVRRACRVCDATLA